MVFNYLNVMGIAKKYLSLYQTYYIFLEIKNIKNILKEIQYTPSMMPQGKTPRGLSKGTFPGT